MKGRIEAHHDLRAEPIALVNFGPSLNDTWEKIREFKFVMTCSGAHKFCVDHGIVPTHHIDVDPREHKIKLIGTPQPTTEYLIASTCHPKLFDFLIEAGCKTKLWHIFDNDEHGMRVLPHGEWAITGGCSVGVRTMTLARFLGFTDLHIFGMDGCFGKQGTHAAEHPNKPRADFILDYEGREFHTTPSMLEAVKNVWHELDMMKDVKATFYGDGLVQAMSRNYKRQEIPGVTFIAFNKPELISAEYLQLNKRLHADNLAYGVGGGRHAPLVLKLAKSLSKNGEFVSILDYGCQPLDAKILTPTGWKRMRDIDVGHEVIGSSGLATTVVGVHSPGVVQVYKVDFTDGSSLIVDGNHLWAVRTQNHQKRRQPFIVKRTVELIGDLRWTNANPLKWRIPMTKPAQFKPGPALPVDPYLFGLLLGDGNFSQGCPKLFAKRSGIVRQAEVALGENAKLSKDRTCPSAYRIVATKKVNPVTLAIRGYGLWGVRAWEKFIPDCYLMGAVPDRIALLQGLMDTDGEVGRHHLSYSSTSRRLADDVAFLVQTLGGIARVVERKRSKFPYKGQLRTGRRSYVVHLKVPPSIAPTREKHWSGTVEYHANRIISSVEPCGQQEVKGISVESDDGLYVTEHCIVTHNCGKGYLGKALDFPIAEYDPAIAGKQDAPRPADLVCCLDVLEHIEPDRLEFVLGDLLRCTKQIGLFVIYTEPSQKVLADGRNAHLIVEGQEWWTKQIEKFFHIPEKGVTYHKPLLYFIVAPKPRKTTALGNKMKVAQPVPA